MPREKEYFALFVWLLLNIIWFSGAKTKFRRYGGGKQRISGFDARREQFFEFRVSDFSRQVIGTTLFLVCDLTPFSRTEEATPWRIRIFERKEKNGEICGKSRNESNGRTLFSPLRHRAKTIHLKKSWGRKRHFRSLLSRMYFFAPFQASQFLEMPTAV